MADNNIDIDIDASGKGREGKEKIKYTGFTAISRSGCGMGVGDDAYRDFIHAEVPNLDDVSLKAHGESPRTPEATGPEMEWPTESSALATCAGWAQPERICTNARRGIVRGSHDGEPPDRTDRDSAESTAGGLIRLSVDGAGRDTRETYATALASAVFFLRTAAEMNCGRQGWRVACAEMKCAAIGVG
ncbi:hypothetical protein B0H10DRAFT_1946299 [Mycena sp. CBHHK59/15]|nr:hypothetical protein B0H10DRAFT_1946299 [Mycena sp. CBHHK59/15]